MLLSYNMLHLLVFLFIYMFKIFTNITNLKYIYIFFLIFLCPDFPCEHGTIIYI